MCSTRSIVAELRTWRAISAVYRDVGNALCQALATPLSLNSTASYYQRAGSS
jgi:hypothetical protein